MNSIHNLGIRTPEEIIRTSELRDNRDNEIRKWKGLMPLTFEEWRFVEYVGDLGFMTARSHPKRAVLSRETSALVTASVTKDLGHVKTDEMPKHLQDVLQL